MEYKNICKIEKPQNEIRVAKLKQKKHVEKKAEINEKKVFGFESVKKKDKKAPKKVIKKRRKKKKKTK